MKSTVTDLPIALNGIRPKLLKKSSVNTLDSIILAAAQGKYNQPKPANQKLTPKDILISQLGLLMPFTADIIAEVKRGQYDVPPD